MAKKDARPSCTAEIQSQDIWHCGPFVRELSGGQAHTCSRAAVVTVDGKGYCRQHARKAEKRGA